MLFGLGAVSELIVLEVWLQQVVPELRELAEHMLLEVVLRFGVILDQSQHDEQVAANDVAFC
jgi:hypothetical protein